MDNIIILGVVISIVYYEMLKISPGGLIVPGYLVLFIDQPERILITILLSMFTLAIYRILSKYSILYGRRRYAVMVIISFMLRYVLGIGLAYGGFLYLTEGVIGNIIPGIIANDFERQGIIKTVASLIIVMVILVLIMMLLKGDLIL